MRIVIYWLFSFPVLLTVVTHLVRKEKSCGYPNEEKEALLAACIVAHPLHCHALASLLQFPAANVHRHSLFLLVPTPMGYHHGHYYSCGLLC